MAFRVIKTYKEKRQFAAREFVTAALRRLNSISRLMRWKNFRTSSHRLRCRIKGSHGAGPQETDTHDPRVDQLDLPAGAQGVDVTSLDDVDENVDFGLSVRNSFSLIIMCRFRTRSQVLPNTSASGARLYRGLGFRYS